MTEYKQQLFTGERALFASKGLKLTDCTFLDGESPLKESSDLLLDGCFFKWKYPLWYCTDVTAENITLLDSARSGIWYTNNIHIKNSIIEAPKTFRRASGIHLDGVNMPNAQETLWNCSDIHLKDLHARGDYFAMNSSDITGKQVHLSGNYAFDGGRNIYLDGCTLMSKDAFWNCENVVVKNSLIVGEYLGWNSKNLTFENCTIESLQGMCYIEGLTLINCKLINTTLAFEYSSVDAQVVNHIDSVFNPSSGTVSAHSIGELTMDGTKIDPEATKIVTKE